jgi:hypothetical protein
MIIAGIEAMAHLIMNAVMLQKGRSRSTIRTGFDGSLLMWWLDYFVRGLAVPKFLNGELSTLWVGIGVVNKRLKASSGLATKWAAGNSGHR